jgi:phospholipid/cholesterol/gamma-HCH transport system substrate-binding protein
MSGTRELTVGVFVLASTALALGGVIAIGSGTLFKHTETIETSTTDSVNGLQIGSPVKYRGVPIGEVSSISFADRLYPAGADDFDFASPVVIRMKVRLDVFGPEQSERFTQSIGDGVARGLRARLTSAGLTGGLFVDLDLNDPTLFPIAKLPYEPLFPYIPTAPSRLDQLIDRIQVIAANLSEVDFSSLGGSLQKTVDDINNVVERRVNPMFADAQVFIKELRASNQQIQNILADPAIAATISNASTFTGDLRDVFGESKQGLKDGLAEIPAMMKSARAAADRLDAILQSERLLSILAKLDETSGELPATVAEYRAIGQQLQEFLASESYEIRQLIEALRKTSENLAELTGSAKTDLGQTLFGNPPPRLAPGEPSRTPKR